MKADITVIGGGPAGMTAALYCAMSGAKTVLAEKGLFGGQMRLAETIENYPGILNINGAVLSEQMKKQILENGVEIAEFEVSSIKKEHNKIICSSTEKTITSKALIIAVGSKKRQLGLEEEEKFVGHGISYCALCDAVFFKGKTVAVIGSGSSAASEALYLSNLCSKVYIIIRNDKMKCSDTLMREISLKNNIEIINNSSVIRINGDSSVQSIMLFNKVSKSYSTVYAKGIFVSIGTVPQTESFSALVPCDKNGYIITDGNFHTAVNGIFACGDCTTDIHQITTAIGSAASAAVNACKYIKTV